MFTVNSVNLKAIQINVFKVINGTSDIYELLKATILVKRLAYLGINRSINMK